MDRRTALDERTSGRQLFQFPVDAEERIPFSQQLQIPSRRLGIAASRQFFKLGHGRDAVEQRRQFGLFKCHFDVEIICRFSR